MTSEISGGPAGPGRGVATDPNARLATQLDGFFDFLVTSSYLDLLNEYSTASTRLQRGERLASARVSVCEPGTPAASFRQSRMRRSRWPCGSIAGWIADTTVPAATANTFLSPNVVSVLGPSRSCQNFCGYHNHIGGVYYAIIPFADCPAVYLCNLQRHGLAAISSRPNGEIPRTHA